MIIKERRVDYGGPPVTEDRTVRYLSASSLTVADVRQYGGCLLRWWFKYVARKPEPETRAKVIGTVLHKEVEHYELTGERTLGRLAMAGERFIPTRGDDLLVEQEISGEIGVRPPVAFSRPVLYAAGIPLVGQIDLVKFRREWIRLDGETEIDVGNTVELIDWKSTSDWSYAKTGPELLKTVQMVGYGEWSFRTWPHLEHARLSHVYFLTKGTPDARKATVLATRAQIGSAWEQTENVARNIIEAARLTRPEDVPANTAACKAWRGCPHAGYCPAAQRTSLTKLFGEKTMSLLGNGSPFTGAVVPPVAAAPAAGVTPFLSGAGVGVTIDPQIAALQAQEAAMQAQQAAANAAALQAQQAAAAAAAQFPPGFIDALRYVKGNAHGRGFPITSGKCGDLVAAACGWNVPPGTVHNGEGALLDAKIHLTDPAHMLQLAGELETLAKAEAVARDHAASLAAAAVQAAAAPVGIAPPDAPGSNPALAATPLPQSVVPGSPAAGPATPSIAIPSGGDKPKRGRGRPKKSEAAATAPGTAPPATATEDGTPSHGIELFVDCIPSIEYASFHPIADQLVEMIRAKAELDDIRLAPKESPLAFGGWRGAVQAMVRMRADSIPHGAYVLDTRGSEIAEIVADAMRGVCEASGGVFVRGIR